MFAQPKDVGNEKPALDLLFGSVAAV